MLLNCREEKMMTDSKKHDPAEETEQEKDIDIEAEVSEEHSEAEGDNPETSGEEDEGEKGGSTGEEGGEGETESDGDGSEQSREDAEESDSSGNGDINTDWKDKYTRLYAEFQNFRRRVDKEKSDIYQYANEKIALDIIEVLDNFDRAVAHADEAQDKSFAEGVLLIYKQLKNVLDKNNILEIEAEEKEFDPNFHSAVMTEDNPDYESGIVIQAMQKGYTLNGKVVRPAMVKVSQ
jgi:molecular chaperone GrpE